MDQEDGNCLHDQGQRQYFLTNEGELTIPQPTGPAIEGVVSADSLTILMAAQDPDEDDLIDGYAEVNEGERATLISVKLDEELESLAGRRYRLFSQGLDARMLTFKSVRRASWQHVPANGSASTICNRALLPRPQTPP